MYALRGEGSNKKRNSIALKHPRGRKCVKIPTFACIYFKDGAILKSSHLHWNKKEEKEYIKPGSHLCFNKFNMTALPFSFISVIKIQNCAAQF